MLPVLWCVTRDPRFEVSRLTFPLRLSIGLAKLLSLFWFSECSRSSALWKLR